MFVLDEIVLVLLKNHTIFYFRKTPPEKHYDFRPYIFLQWSVTLRHVTFENTPDHAEK